MYKSKKLMFLTTETPMHAGSGSDLGIVDLPIQRERHTGFPKIEASSLKGALRESFEGINDKFEVSGKTIDIGGKADNKDLHLVFGPEGDDAHAGAIGFSDARLLLFPVKSMKGVFAWVTCTKVLAQFKRDMEVIYDNADNSDNKIDIKIPEFDKLGENTCYSNSAKLTIEKEKKSEKFIALEEYTFDCHKIEDEFRINNNEFGEWLSENAVSKDSAWSEKIKSDIVVLSDDDFKDFTELSTEVITRTKIDNETGTVATGALFTEEYLPAETVMYSLAFASDFFLDDEQKKKYKADKYPSKLLEIEKDQKETHKLVMEFLEKGFIALNNIVQIGGNATLGKGLTHIKIV
jgi:CRISPR-associated protein Cmr4